MGKVDLNDNRDLELDQQPLGLSESVNFIPALQKSLKSLEVNPLSVEGGGSHLVQTGNFLKPFMPLEIFFSE